MAARLFFRRRRSYVSRRCILAEAPLPGVTENKLLPGHVDPFGAKSGIQPDLRHGAVRRIVAPPGTVHIGRAGQLLADDFLNLSESNRHLLGTLPPQEWA